MAPYKSLLFMLALFLSLVAPAGAYDWIQGESGLGLQWNPNCLANSPFGGCTPTPAVTNLAGSNVQILIQPQDGSLPVQAYPCPIINNGASCEYVTSGADFTQSGLWQIEFLATFANGMRKSQIVVKSVGPALQ